MTFQDQKDNAHHVAPRICLGKVTTAHGVRGLVKVLVFGEDPYLLEEFSPLYTSEDGTKTITLEMKSSGGKYWIASVEGVQDRNQAELLRNTELWVDRDRLPETEEEEFYISDLVGMPVIDTTDKKIGKVVDIKNFGAGDLIEIRPATGDSFYVPFTKEAVPDITDEAVIISPEAVS
jgi:16S rRNA processing protein RimM